MVLNNIIEFRTRLTMKSYDLTLNNIPACCALLTRLKKGAKLKPKLSDFQVCRRYKEDVVSL